MKKNSHIYKLDPYLEDGVLRVGGRLTRSTMLLEAKHPAILHKDDWIAKLVLRHIHEETGHWSKSCSRTTETKVLDTESLLSNTENDLRV